MNEGDVLRNTLQTKAPDAPPQNSLILSFRRRRFDANVDVNPYAANAAPTPISVHPSKQETGVP